MNKLLLSLGGAILFIVLMVIENRISEKIETATVYFSNFAKAFACIFLVLLATEYTDSDIISVGSVPF